MPPRTWITSKDGKFEFNSMTKDTLEGGLNVMRKSFFIDENVSRAVELYKYPNASKELEELSYDAAKNGCSIVAIEKETGKIVGVAFNKVQVPAKPGDDNYFENFEAKCKEPSSKGLIRFMIEADAECDLFEHCKIDCILELMFVATLPEYRGNKIGRLLFEASIMLARALKKGENVKTGLSGEQLTLQPVPKAAAAINTTFITQKIGKSLGFEVAKEMDFSRWSFDGKTFAERIGPETPSTTLEYLML